MILPETFYQHNDVVSIARDLLGKVLVTCFQDSVTSGVIVETEAYAGSIDRASHAFGFRKTKRTAVMYRPGGVAYVYLCYGIHHLFNVVTGEKGVPHAILIRALEPLDGIHKIRERRGKSATTPALTAGPGVLTQAMGLRTQHTGIQLKGPEIWIEDRGTVLPAENIVATTRVGVDYAGSDALLPYRFYIKNNIYVSAAKGLSLKEKHRSLKKPDENSDLKF